jgi:hypothetical protein
VCTRENNTAQVVHGNSRKQPAAGGRTANKHSSGLVATCPAFNRTSTMLVLESSLTVYFNIFRTKYVHLRSTSSTERRAVCCSPALISSRVTYMLHLFSADYKTTRIKFFLCIRLDLISPTIEGIYAERPFSLSLSLSLSYGVCVCVFV